MSTVPFSRSRVAPLPPDLSRRIPSNIDAERSILGAILLDNNALASAQKSGINRYDFFFEHHQTIYGHMAELALRHTAIDLVTLTEEMHVKGDLEKAGGAPYLASLSDGMPRVSNVGHYVKIVREKAVRRHLIHSLHSIQENAFDGEIAVNELFTQAIAGVDFAEKYFLNGHAKGKQLIAVDFCDLLTMVVPPVEYVIDPVVPFRGTTMTYAWRGVGKTYFTMEQAFCVAMGVDSVFGWPIPRRRKVVYVDGELDSGTLQERAQEIAKGHNMKIEPGWLKLIGIDFQEDIRPKINSTEGRRQIEDHLEPGVWLILDNWDTLCPSGGEKDQETCLMMQDWFLDLRKKHITNTFLHHAGKSGEQRGFSGKEDILGSVIRMGEPQNYDKGSEGLRATVEITKKRGKPKPNLLQPFEVTLTTGADGSVQWTMRPLLKLQLERAFRMFAADMNAAEVALELNLKNRYVAYRWKKKFKENPDANAWDPALP